jgi:hypothetical protein
MFPRTTTDLTVLCTLPAVEKIEVRMWGRPPRTVPVLQWTPICYLEGSQDFVPEATELKLQGPAIDGFSKTPTVVVAALSQEVVFGRRG